MTYGVVSGLSGGAPGGGSGHGRPEPAAQSSPGEAAAVQMVFRASHTGLLKQQPASRTAAHQPNSEVFQQTARSDADAEKPWDDPISRQMSVQAPASPCRRALLPNVRRQTGYPAYNPCIPGGNVGSRGWSSSSIIVWSHSSERRRSYVSLRKGYPDRRRTVGSALSMNAQRSRSNWARYILDVTRPSTANAWTSSTANARRSAVGGAFTATVMSSCSGTLAERSIPRASQPCTTRTFRPARRRLATFGSARSSTTWRRSWSACSRFHERCLNVRSCCCARQVRWLVGGSGTRGMTTPRWPGCHAICRGPRPAA